MIRAIEHHPAATWPEDDASDSITLDFDNRHRRRIRLTTNAGAPVLLDLPKAVAMAHGDGLRLEDGGWLRIEAAPEGLVEVSADDATQLARIAWHVGNRHFPAQILDGAIRIRPDHVIEAMIVGLGGSLRRLDAPFQPEGGAYAGQATHGHGDGHHHGHSHDLGHDHGPAHEHSHHGEDHPHHGHGAGGAHADHHHDSGDTHDHGHDHPHGGHHRHGHGAGGARAHNDNGSDRASDAGQDHPRHADGHGLGDAHAYHDHGDHEHAHGARHQEPGVDHGPQPDPEHAHGRPQAHDR